MMFNNIDIVILPKSKPDKITTTLFILMFWVIVLIVDMHIQSSTGWQKEGVIK